MKRINTLLLLMLFSCKMLAVVWHNVNIDRTTATAMTAAYEAEIAMETMAKEHLQNILNHYRSASVATAGILVSKRKTGMPCATLVFLRQRKTTTTLESWIW